MPLRSSSPASCSSPASSVPPRHSTYGAGLRASLLSSLTALAGLFACSGDGPGPEASTREDTRPQDEAQAPPDEVLDAQCAADPSYSLRCRARALRGAASCPGDAFRDEQADVDGPCLALAPAAPRPPEPSAQPRAWTQLQDSAPCPAPFAPAACQDAPPCAPAGQAFPEEAALLTWAALRLSTRIIYVDPSSAASGTGSREAPFASLEAALHEAPVDATLVLARGRYAGPWTLRRAVRLVGACDGESVLIDGSPREGSLLAIRAPDAQLYTLTVSTEGTGLFVAANAQVLLRGVRFTAARARSVRVEGGAVAHLQDVRWDAAIGGAEGAALRVDGGNVSGRRLAIEGAWATAVLVVDGGDAHLADLSLRGPDTYQPESFALRVGSDATLHVERVLAHNAAHNLVLVDGRAGAGSHARIGDVTISAHPRPASGAGTATLFLGLGDAALHVERLQAAAVEALGFSSEGTSRFTLVDIDLARIAGYRGVQGFHIPAQALDRSQQHYTRVRIGDATAVAFQVMDNATLVVEDLELQEVRPSSGLPGPGRAINALTDGTVTLRRGRIRFGGDIGVLVTATGVDIEDLDVAPSDSGLRIGGRGIQVQGRGTLRAQRIALRDMTLGLALLPGTGPATIDDALLVGVGYREGDFTEAFGGLRLDNMLGSTLRRVALIDSGFPALQLSEGVHHLEDLYIGSLDPAASPGPRGVVVDNASVTLERLHATHLAGYGLLIFGPRANVTASDVALLESRFAPCSAPDCVADGCAVTLIEGTLTLRDFWIRDATLAGICALRSAGLSAERGTLIENQRALLLQASSVDLDRDFTDVLLLRNQLNISTDQFQVGRPAPGLDAAPR
mgnify:CR=1 FL=1